MKQPLIGIVPLVDEARESYWMLPGYMQGVEQAGGVPVMLPLTDDAAALRQLADTCDGFLPTGRQPALGPFGQGCAGCEQPAPSGHKNACAGAGGYGRLGGWTDGGCMPAG